MKRPMFQDNPIDKGYESSLAWKNGKTMVFRKPPAARRMETLLSVAVTVQIVALPLVGAVLTGKPVLAAASLGGLGGVLWFLYRVVGPNDIRLDGERCIYERTTGWPWKPVTQTGPFSDIKGVCISPRHDVVLSITKPGGASRRVIVSSPFLSSVGSSGLVIDRSHLAKSHTLAEELNRTYGFPILPYPKT